MQNLFVLLAEYNARANREMFGILRKAPPDVLNRAAGSYYGTIMGLLNHLLVTDLGWLNAYRKSDLKLRSLDTPVLEFTHPGFGKPLYAELPGLWERRRRVDRVLGGMAAELTDGLLAGEVVLRNPRGGQERFVLGQVLLHLFNHQTHHRGQIAQILDSQGVDNDYSNILSLLRRRPG